MMTSFFSFAGGRLRAFFHMAGRIRFPRLADMERFFLFCSGTDPELLKDCSQSTKTKYIALGWLVLTPAVLALWSGTYFFSTIFRDHLFLSICFGFLWGLIILNIDRYLIITFDKGNSLLKDIFSFSVFSRLIIAVFIAYAIAHPIVLRLFSDNIEEHIFSRNEGRKEEIRKDYNAKIDAIEAEITKLNAEISQKGNALVYASAEGESREISALRKEVANTGREISELRRELNKSHEELSDEIAGSSTRTGKKGHGPVARSIELKMESLNAQIQKSEEQYRRLEEQLAHAVEREKADFGMKKESLEFGKNELAALTARNSILMEDRKNEIARLRNLRDEKVQALESKAAMDFLARSNALDELSQNNFNVKKWNWLLTAIFILLDILPILWKVIPRKDAYELKLETCRMSAADYEGVERKAIEKMKEIREQTAVKGLRYESIRQEMGKLGRHKSELLNTFNEFFEMKVRQDRMFIAKIKEQKAEAETIADLDKSNKIEEGIHSTVKGYFNHTGDMTKLMIDFLHKEDNTEPQEQVPEKVSET
ncbi:MAG: DUF4407 domain-containing protein [Desulfobacterales bacterium]